MSQTSEIRRHSGLRRLLRTDEVSVFIPLLVIMAITTVFRPDFLTVKNFSAMFTQIPFIAVVALGVSFPLMTGNVDISTGRVAGFAGIVMSSLVNTMPSLVTPLLMGFAMGSASLYNHKPV